MYYRDKVVTVDTMKAHRGVTVHPHSLLILALDIGEWSTSCPGRFNPTKTDPSTHFIPLPYSHPNQELTY